MLLSLNHLYPSPPSKTLTNHSSPLLPIPKPQFSLNPTPKTPSKSLIRSSKHDSQTLPHSAIQRIADKLRSLGFADQIPDANRSQSINSSSESESKSVGEIFIPLPNQLPKYRVGHTLDPSWSTPENPVPQPGSGIAIARYHELRNEVKKEREELKRRGRVPTLAELSVPEEELRRLRTIGIREKRKLKVGKAGITEGIVNGIHERWRSAEVVKIVCEDLCRMNMKRTHDMLERKTGGLVVWRSGSKIVLYRGANYKYPYFLLDNISNNETSPDTVKNVDVDNGGIDKMESCKSGMKGAESRGQNPTDKTIQPALIQGVGVPNRVRFQLPGEAQLAEEVDRLLDGLGPRFTDWWGCDPLPVDADLLPAVVPGYRRPFRLLPYGVKPKLTNDEMTTLKRLGRPLPCHFALSRNRKLQGLAASIIKLWEKCEIAKIAVKRGAQNTNSELMAEELKWLTGGILISRDREFIVFYRGKDFLPSAVSLAIDERRKYGIHGDKKQASGETAEELRDGTINHDARDELDGTNEQRSNLSENRKPRSTEAAIKRTSIKLSMALEKKAKAKKLLAELEKAEMPQQPEIDKEGITDEERYMLRKIGLKMKPFLLMGRRGVFDGTIENMHLHWKYRELVKLVCKERSFEAVRRVAWTLEVESGGILVAVEKVSKGYAIIVYRGKNYSRPACLRPPTLLSKREALKRSLEAQRRESLKLHVLRLTRNIDDLKLQLVKDKEAVNMQSFDKSRFQVNAEMNNMESARLVRSDTKLKPDHDSSSIIPAHLKENVDTRDTLGADSNSVNLSNGLDASVNSAQPTQQSNGSDLSTIFDGNKTGRSESESDIKGTHENPLTCISGGAVEATSLPDNIMSKEAGDCVLVNKDMELIVETAKKELEQSASSVVEEGNEMPSRVVHLSNRDRLLLRKQALKMKKRPVLAVGRSNIVTGVAKTIKAHFQKYPLAIVNVKGRAKGTSVQEVVFKLEQATGAVLVSQEPSKVILYRGWGADDEPGHKTKKTAQNARKTSVGREGGARHGVSPELMAAIRVECGLLHNQEKKVTPSADT